MAVAHRHLTVLISSKQAEFAGERADIVQIVRPLPLLVANAAEHWAPETKSVEDKSVDEAAGSAIYVGLFGCIYSEPTVMEYRAARQNPHREVLIYVKDCATRDRALDEFLGSVLQARTGHTVVRFANWADARDRFAEHLWDAVGRMIDRLMRLGNPPVAMGGGGVLERKWNAERAALLALGLPVRSEDALEMAEHLRRERSKWASG
jgi:hypothetical protein